MHILYILSKEMNISYDDMNKMPFFEILKLLEVYEEHMKEQQKANEKENARIENQMSSMQKNYNVNNISKQINNQNNLSGMQNFKVPNFNMNIPKI